jgi:gamma-glutamyltranspeptidase/glutathione hydrolase
MPGMIVVPQPLAVEAGTKVLASGGNAFDAAFACGAVQIVIHPHCCGVRGYLLFAATRS